MMIWFDSIYYGVIVLVSLWIVALVFICLIHKDDERDRVDYEDEEPAKVEW